MDTKTLITIVITAVITAFARQFVSWVMQLATQAAATLAGMLKRSVTPILERIGRSPMLLFDLFMLGFAVQVCGAKCGTTAPSRAWWSWEFPSRSACSFIGS
jgi:hypothetical protein